MTINPHSGNSGERGGIPKHEQLRDYLLQELREGRLKPGETMPTELSLVAQRGVSRNTVRQALADLERNGLIRRVRGSGTFVHESAMERLKHGLDVFALVIPDTRGGFYPSLQRGFHGAAGERQNQVIVSDTGNDPLQQADALLQLMDKKVGGVALVPTTSPPTPAHQLRPLHERGIPIVFCHRRVEGLQAPLVCFSAREVGWRAGRAMLAQGHRRAAFFALQRAGLSSQYESGLREALAEGNGELPEAFVRYGDASASAEAQDDFLKRNLRDVLAAKRPPTAIFCPFDSVTESLYLLLNNLEVKVPEDVSLVSFGGAWREGALTRRLAAVTVDEEELGRQAARLLDEMRRREKPLDDMTEIVMPLSWSEGETLGPARHKEAVAA